jgi:hypothetical protein
MGQFSSAAAHRRAINCDACRPCDPKYERPSIEVTVEIVDISDDLQMIIATPVDQIRKGETDYWTRDQEPS